MLRLQAYMTSQARGVGLTGLTVRTTLVLWDVDHTLIENNGINKEYYAKAFELLTGRQTGHDARTDGRTDPEIMRNMLVDNGIDPADSYLARVPDVLETAMSISADTLRERGHALAGAEKSLAALQDAPGIVQSVLSGNIRPNAFTKLSVFGLHIYLDFEIGGYGSDDSVRANLVSVARRRAKAKYGIEFDKSTTVLIGDTQRDVRAGLDGGAHVVAVATGPDTEQTLREAGADVVLPDLRDTEAVVAAITNLS